MRLLYVSLSSLPSTQANTVQVMHTCAALAARGHDVTLVVKRGVSDVRGGDIDDPYAHYGVPRSFTIVRKPRPRRRGGDLVYSLAVARFIHAARSAGSVDAVYARHIPGAVVAAELGVPTFFEAHGVGHTRSEALLWRRLVRLDAYAGVIAITRALADELARIGRSPKRAGGAIHVVPDASDDLGGAHATRRSTRARSGARFTLGYAGTLSRAKGLALLIDIARALPAIEVRVAGAARDDTRALIDAAPPNFTSAGALAPRDVGAFLRSCDAIAAPYPSTGVTGAKGGEDITRWMSPLKIFEAMSSGTPLLASDLPVLREVLRDGENALLVKADEVRAWCDAIERLRRDEGVAERIAKTARAQWAARYSYGARAEAIERVITNGVESR